MSNAMLQLIAALSPEEKALLSEAITVAPKAKKAKKAVADNTSFGPNVSVGLFKGHKVVTIALNVNGNIRPISMGKSKLSAIFQNLEMVRKAYDTIK